MSIIVIASPFLHCGKRATVEWRNIEVIVGDRAAREEAVIGNAVYHPVLGILVMKACKEQTYENSFFHRNTEEKSDIKTLYYIKKAIIQNIVYRFDLNIYL